MKLTRDVWLNDLKVKQYGEVKFVQNFDYDTMMSPMEMIFQHRCATAMLILLNGVFSKTHVSIYELFISHMEADFEALDKYLCDRDPMANYPKEDFTQKKLHEVIPRFVEFYKEILGAKHENGTPLIDLFDKNDTCILSHKKFFDANVRLALAMIKMESLEFDYKFFELVFSIPGLSLWSSMSKIFLRDLWKTFDFETGEEQDMIFKLLPLFRLNLDFINEEDIDPEFLDSILSKPKLSFRILKFLGISPKGRSRIAITLRFHFNKLKERHEQKPELYYWYDDAVKRLHDFMKREFDDQRWLEFMQDLRKDQLND